MRSMQLASIGTKANLVTAELVTLSNFAVPRRLILRAVQIAFSECWTLDVFDMNCITPRD